MTETKERRGALPSLTSLRAFAALVVFAYHLGSGLFPLDLNGYGYAGVTFFYVLSGYVLTWGSASNGGLRRFYTRRFFRIYPSHLAVITVALVVLTAFAGFHDVKTAIAQVLLVQAWSPDVTTVWGLNGVAWSLSCEFFFYALFPFIVRGASRLSAPVFLAAAGVLLVVEAACTVAASHLVENDPLWMIATTNPVVRLPEFVLGVALARFVAAGRRFHWTAGVVTTGVCVAGFLLVPVRPAPNVWLAPLVGLLIVFCTRRDVAGRQLLGQRPLVYAGEISFAFYLVHQLVVNYVGPRVNLGPGWPQACATFAVSVACAIALHHLVEKPSFRFFAARADRRVARVPVARRAPAPAPAPVPAA